MSGGSKIRVGHALPGPGSASHVAAHDYSSLIGHSASLKSSGENISFDPLLPAHGVLTRQIALSDWGNDWLVLQLDVPIQYCQRTLSYCVIRARWVGHPIGAEFCPVFVLTDAENWLAHKNSWASVDFHFVSWAELDVDAAT